MITSLTIRNRTTGNTHTDKTLSGFINISGGCYTTVEQSSQTVSLDVDYYTNSDNSDQTPTKMMAIWNGVQVLANFPYLTAIVAPGVSDSFVTTMRDNDAWILNGNLTMVTPDKNRANGLIYTDIGKRALSDEDFQDLQDCCRILRSWLDMAKDNMLSTELKWNPAPYQANRPNCSHCNSFINNNLAADCPVCITASQKPLALYKQYKALVWLWNYLTGYTGAQLKVAAHPADAAGLIVAVTVNLPKCFDTSLATAPIKRLKVTVQADIQSAQIPVLLFWARRTMVASSPSCTQLSDVPISIDVEKTSETTATLYIESYVMLKPHSTYQAVSVFEIFPYYKDQSGSTSGDSGNFIEGSMDGYYNSRSNYNYDAQGTSSWNFTVSISYDEYMEAVTPLITLTRSTSTPYAAAPEPESESGPGS